VEGSRATADAVTAGWPIPIGPPPPAGDRLGSLPNVCTAGLDESISICMNGLSGEGDSGVQENLSQAIKCLTRRIKHTSITSEHPTIQERSGQHVLNERVIGDFRGDSQVTLFVGLNAPPQLMEEVQERRLLVASLAAY